MCHHPKMALRNVRLPLGAALLALVAAIAVVVVTRPTADTYRRDTSDTTHAGTAVLAGGQESTSDRVNDGVSDAGGHVSSTVGASAVERPPVIADRSDPTLPPRNGNRSPPT